MIKGKGRFRKVNGVSHINELKDVLEKLPDNQDYNFLIYDDKANRLLPYQQYLFSVVLRYISEQLPDHPAPIGLYRYFEDMFAPLHTCTINGQTYEYTDLKGEKKNDVVNFVERINEYVLKHWGIEVPHIEDLKSVENRDLNAEVYANQEAKLAKFISSRNHNKS